jgi:hypothetical protein
MQSSWVLHVPRHLPLLHSIFVVTKGEREETVQSAVVVHLRGVRLLKRPGVCTHATPANDISMLHWLGFLPVPNASTLERWSLPSGPIEASSAPTVPSTIKTNADSRPDQSDSRSPIKPRHTALERTEEGAAPRPRDAYPPSGPGPTATPPDGRTDLGEDVPVAVGVVARAALARQGDEVLVVQVDRVPPTAWPCKQPAAGGIIVSHRQQLSSSSSASPAVAVLLLATTWHSVPPHHTTTTDTTPCKAAP